MKKPLHPLHQAGRLVGVDIAGYRLSDETKLHLEHFQFGGVCLFLKNCQNREQVAELVKEIREVLPHAWISIDQEGGAVFRTTDLPFAPSAMALGAIGSEEVAEQVGAAVGRGLRSLGINWNYAPVLDVNINPLNPVIGDRSFGSSPTGVAELGLAWAKGLQSVGVAATAKHFPGHGDTSLDSHLALPRVDKPLEVLEATELYPFKQAVQSGIAAVMTAHILYPALDRDLPATLSPKILTGLLREQWGFEGAIVTDSMGMKAIADNYSAGGAAVQSVKAGADIVLALGRLETQIEQVEALAKAIVLGEIGHEQLEASYVRLNKLTKQYPAKPKAYSAKQEQADLALMAEVAARSITAVGRVRLPQQAQHIVLLMPDVAVGENVYETGLRAENLAKVLSQYFSHLEVLTFPKENPRIAAAPLAVMCRQADFVLYASTARGKLSELEVELALSAFTQNKPALHLALWNPYHALQIGQPALLSYGFRQPSLQALARALAGEPILGKLPIDIR